MKRIVRTGIVLSAAIALGTSLLTPPSQSFGFRSNVVHAQTEEVTITIDYFTTDYSDSGNPGGTVRTIHPSETVTLQPGETIRLEPKQVAGYVTPSPKEISYNSYVYLFKKYGGTVDNIGFRYEKQIASPVYNFTVEEAQAYIDTWKALHETLRSINTLDFSLYTDESINKGYVEREFSGSIATTIDIRRDILTDLRPPTVEEVRQYNTFGGLAWAKLGMEADLSILKQAFAGLQKKSSTTAPSSKTQPSSTTSSAQTDYAFRIITVGVDANGKKVSLQPSSEAEVSQARPYTVQAPKFAEWIVSRISLRVGDKTFDLKNGSVITVGHFKDASPYMLYPGDLVYEYKKVQSSAIQSSSSTTKVTSSTKPSSATKPSSTTQSSTTKPTRPQTSPAGSIIPVYRLYNSALQVHLYTTDQNEVTVLKGRGWTYEGISWKTEKSAGAPVYRLYHEGLKVHLYTKDANEYKVLATRGWRQEGTAYRSQGSVAVYRMYHPGIRKHLYTKDANEYKVLATRGWNQEGVAWHSQP